MTLEELDKMLEQTGLDLSNPLDLDARNRVLALHGKMIMDSKEQICGKCWYKENNKCSENCFYYDMKDPIEVSKAYLKSENEIKVFPFFAQFVVPVYEEITGDKGILKRIYQKVKDKRE